MKRIGLATIVVVSAIAIALIGAPQAQSRPQYNKEFSSKYINRNSTDSNEKSFADSAVKAKCTICHMGDSKKDRNAFGRELAKLLHNEKDPAKIDDAFDSVLKMKADPQDPNSPTYGELMKQGKLPTSE